MLEGLEGFTALQWTAMLAIAALSGLVHGFVGVGFPLLATPLFALMFGFQLAVVLLVLPTLAMTLCTLYAFHGSVRLREVLRVYWPLPVMMPIGLVAGVWALFALDAAVLMLLMAAVIVGYLLMDWLGRVETAPLRRAPTAWALPFGLFAGFCEGAINVAGPTLLIYFLLLEMPVASIIATMNYLFLLGKSVQALLLAQRGVLTGAVLQVAVPLAVAGALAYASGLALRRRFDPSRYRAWLKWTLAAVAAVLVLRVLSGAT